MTEIDMDAVRTMRVEGREFLEIAKEISVPYGKLMRGIQREQLAENKKLWWPRYKGGETMQEIAESCGVTRACVSLSLKSEGRLTSRRAMARAKQLQVKFRIGSTHYHWTVCDAPYYDKLYKGWRVPCTCVCGNEADVNVLQIEKGLRTNCGCIKKVRKEKE